MKILLINPPYQTLTSNLGVGNQVPLGLLLVGGSLIDAGFDVKLLDAEALHLSDEQIIEHAATLRPEVVMTGHAGSTPAHPVCMRMLRQIKAALPQTVTVYGGVFPTYHSESVLRDESAVDVIVRGEGEVTAVDLARAIARGPSCDLLRVASIAFRHERRSVLTPDRAPITDLNQGRAAWELIDDWDRYQCFGLGRAAIVQFSRGCPHRCTYCGQHSFWGRWRHRDPKAVADEVARLHHEHGVRFITLADENPTTSKGLWRSLLEEVIARRVDVQFFSTIRATDIVRDADMLELYKRAGLLYILLGIDTTDPETQKRVDKRSTTEIDAKACRLLKEHGIRSIAAHIVGLGDETRADFRRARRVLSDCDADLINVMYATPHSWTRFAEESASRGLIQTDQRRWDYRHQVLEQTHLSPFGLFAAVKWLELAHHLHPRRLRRLLFNLDPKLRRQFFWTQLRITMVWLGEIVEFLFRTRFVHQPRPLREWLDAHRPRATSADTKIALTVRGGPRPQTRRVRDTVKMASSSVS
jgi:anaerobic magnesium-protoporphyrin IX monomethyl ester cyclase